MLFFQRDGLHKKISGGLECDVECGLTFSLKNIFKPYGIRSPTMLTLTSLRKSMISHISVKQTWHEGNTNLFSKRVLH